MLHRKYVDVIARVNTLDYLGMKPKFIKIESKLYPIEIHGFRETFCKTGGSAMRYECRIGSQERELFFDGKAFFLEVEEDHK